MAQTAVDWFFDKLKNHEIQAEHFELYKQAKAMEKEQITGAYLTGIVHPLEMKPTKQAEQYYIKKYNQ
jgi:hypothetical protein